MNSTRTVAFTLEIDGGVQRGLALTGSGKYLAYVDGPLIHVVNETGVETGDLEVPSGTWRGMEFDFSGENLAVFTSDFITVYATSNLTCELDENCAALGGTGDDGKNQGDGDGDGGDLETTGGGVLIPGTPLPEGWTAAALNAF